MKKRTRHLIILVWKFTGTFCMLLFFVHQKSHNYTDLYPSYQFEKLILCHTLNHPTVPPLGKCLVGDPPPLSRKSIALVSSLTRLRLLTGSSTWTCSGTLSYFLTFQSTSLTNFHVILGNSISAVGLVECCLIGVL